VASLEHEDPTATPAILMIASGARAGALRLPANADLGRRIAGDGEGPVHEIVDDRMSRDHAKVRWERGVWIVTDLDSRNGSFVDGERVYGETRRRGDAVLRLGNTVFVLLANGNGHPAPDGAMGPELARAYAQIHQAASGRTLLLVGEPGTGKAAAARAFHDHGPRREGPFVRVSCGAIPDGMGPRLLFGGTRSAPDRAPIATIGHVQMAHGGTLVLDDIAELEDRAQAELARALASDEPSAARELRTIGLVATGHHLRAAVADGRLRQDLHGQLARTMVTLPPLRARRVDLARLVQRELVAVDARLAPHPKFLEGCLIRPWPGNATELRAALRRAADRALADGREQVRIEDLPEHAGLPPGATSTVTAVERGRPARAPLDRAELVDALQRANGIVSAAARTLGVHRTQLYRLLEEHGIAHDD
jgi:DNA-binding NtrC family response regulator